MLGSRCRLHSGSTAGFDLRLVGILSASVEGVAGVVTLADGCGSGAPAPGRLVQLLLFQLGLRLVVTPVIHTTYHSLLHQ